MLLVTMDCLHSQGNNFTHALTHSFYIPVLTLYQFFPWLLGSQCCEKTFQTARSMISMFSTVINFPSKTVSKFKLNECDLTQIKYYWMEAHRKKAGLIIVAIHFPVTKEEILSNVPQVLTMAKQTIEGWHSCMLQSRVI